MFGPLYNTRLKTISEGATAKTDNLNTNNTVFDVVKLSLVNLVETITHQKIFNAVHWVGYIERWHDNLAVTRTNRYNRGDIVYLDLGAQNFGHEPSYPHSCIVLSDVNKYILIVPCSSALYGKGYDDVIDATCADGFNRNTGIQSKSYRWVSKNRVISKVGTASQRVLDAVDTVVLAITPLHSKKIGELNKIIKNKNVEIRNYQIDKKTLENKIIALEEELETLKSKLISE